MRRITTLLFRGPGGEHTVSGWCAFGEYIEAMEKTVPDSTVAPCPDHTLNVEPPSGVKTYDWGNGVVCLRPELSLAI